MIKAISEKYCKNNLVQLNCSSGDFHLIVDADEIILLKVDGEIIINKYANHPSRDLFPTEYHINHPEIFEYNKIYLNFKQSNYRNGFDKNYFFKGKNRALYLSESLIPTTLNKVNIELTREEIEKIFSPCNYDSMYVLNTYERIVMCAKNKTDGSVIAKNIIPSDKEIIKMILKDEKLIKSIIQGTNNINNLNNLSIGMIKNFKLYQRPNLLITSKNGVFNIIYFEIEFLEKDKFKLTQDIVPIIEPTVDDVLEYSSKNVIEYLADPTSQGLTNDQIAQAVKLLPDIKQKDSNKVKKISLFY